MKRKNKVRTIRLVENESTAGPRYEWQIWDGPHQVRVIPLEDERCVNRKS